MPVVAVPASGGTSLAAKLVVVALPVLALAAGLALFALSRRCPATGCESSASTTTVSPPVVPGAPGGAQPGGAGAPNGGGAPSAGGAARSGGGAPAPVGAPSINTGVAVYNGRRATIPVAVDSPGGSATCVGAYNGQGFPFDCASGRFELDGEFGQQLSVRVSASNGGGESTKDVPVDIPLWSTGVIHACSPPPCELVGLNDGPRRDLAHRGTLGDGAPITVECWVEGDSLNTRFDEAGKPSRSTRIFYRLREPNPGMYIWAPFVHDPFDLPQPGVKHC